MGFSQEAGLRDKSPSGVREPERKKGAKYSRTDDVVAILASIVPKFSKIFVEVERSLAAAQIISTSVIGPAFRSKLFPDHISPSTLDLLHELTRLPNAQKFWKKDVADAFNHPRFFSSPSPLVKEHWLRLVRQWAMGDNDRIPELLSRITQPTSAGIMFGVGATSARLDADRKTQLNLRRVALLILASPHDNFVVNVPAIEEKIEELLAATPASSPSSATRAEVYMLLRALILRISPVHLFSIWSVISAELQAVLASALADNPSKVYNDTSLLQACKLLDTLVVVAPEEFQLHEWLFITDSVDAVYRPPRKRSVALVDEISETLGKTSSTTTSGPLTGGEMERDGSLRKPLLGVRTRPPNSRDELMSHVLQPFFSQLSIHAFESTYSGSSPDYEACSDALLEDSFDESTIGRD